MHCSIVSEGFQLGKIIANEPCVVTLSLEYDPHVMESSVPLNGECGPSKPSAEPSNPTGQPFNPRVESSSPTNQPSNHPIEPQTDDDSSGEEYEVRTNNERGRKRGIGRGMPQENEGNIRGKERGRGIPQENKVNEGSSRGKRRGRGRGGGMPQQNQENEGTSSRHASRPYKRPRMMGVGLLVADDSFTTLNPGMSSRRVIDIGTRVSKRSDEVTGDIAINHALEWNGRGNQPLPVKDFNK
ncbi:hypothetical protein HAX54_017899 [Datura stramonium]|uniref:Uncharacterized protein n=1 Tax=Datura stramonium TaxID=4076 RepID=A0ABS8RJ65_DATST|nr:hypothetical protein [Datura stramonium]